MKAEVYLGVVGLLKLILVHLDLQLMLVAHLHQSLCQLALKVLLVAVVQFHHAGLVAPFDLPQLLWGGFQTSPTGLTEGATSTSGPQLTSEWRLFWNSSSSFRVWMRFSPSTLLSISS